MKLFPGHVCPDVTHEVNGFTTRIDASLRKDEKGAAVRQSGRRNMKGREGLSCKGERRRAIKRCIFIIRSETGHGRKRSKKEGRMKRENLEEVKKQKKGVKVKERKG